MSDEATNATQETLMDLSVIEAGDARVQINLHMPPGRSKVQYLQVIYATIKGLVEAADDISTASETADDPEAQPDPEPDTE
jgi:hypothetical protein